MTVTRTRQEGTEEQRGREGQEGASGTTGQDVLYFSRFAIQGEPVRNPYELHRRLWLAFPNMPEASRPFLYQVLHEEKPPQVVMQSALAPAQVDRRDCRLFEVRAFQLDLCDQVLHRFRVCANPTQRLSRTRQRVALTSTGEQLAWLERQLEGSATVVEATVEGTRTVCFTKARRKGTHKVVTFAGVLRVECAKALEGIVRRGIGPAKSFGCGLLLLAGA